MGRRLKSAFLQNIGRLPLHFIESRMDVIRDGSDGDGLISLRRHIPAISVVVIIQHKQLFIHNYSLNWPITV